MSKNKNNGMKIVKVICFIGAIIILLELTIMETYYIFHPTHYKYNDIWIKGKTIEEIEERYGESRKLPYYKELIGYTVFERPGIIIIDERAEKLFYGICIGEDGKAESVGIYALTDLGIKLWKEN